MAKIWYPDLWEPIKVDLDIPETYYGKPETKSFYDYQDPIEGYEVYGDLPVCPNLNNQKRGTDL